jgi:glycosyltransferase involved in cell wall biosynthesis
MKLKPPKVNVCMITYNHEEYIEQAVNSVMMQEIDFPFELVISEDCSTDSTREIILRLKEKYPGKIRLLLNEKNIGIMPNFIAALRACNGQYIALLEADDYWTDPGKLKMQVDILDANPGIAYCAHNAMVIYENNDKPPHSFNLDKPSTVSTIEDLIKRWFTQTGTIVFRRELIAETPEWFPFIHNGDYALGLLLALHGKIFYLDRVMSVYRKHQEGISSHVSRNHGYNNRAWLDMFTKFNKYSNNKYIKEILERIVSMSENFHRNSKAKIEHLQKMIEQKERIIQQLKQQINK